MTKNILNIPLIAIENGFPVHYQNEQMIFFDLDIAIRKIPNSKKSIDWMIGWSKYNEKQRIRFPSDIINDFQSFHDCIQKIGWMKDVFKGRNWFINDGKISFDDGDYNNDDNDDLYIQTSQQKSFLLELSMRKNDHGKVTSRVKKTKRIPHTEVVKNFKNTPSLSLSEVCVEYLKKKNLYFKEVIHQMNNLEVHKPYYMVKVIDTITEDERNMIIHQENNRIYLMKEHCQSEMLLLSIIKGSEERAKHMMEPQEYCYEFNEGIHSFCVTKECILFVLTNNMFLFSVNLHTNESRERNIQEIMSGEGDVYVLKSEKDEFH